MTPCFLYGKVSKVIDVEEKLQQAYLYDFYGELLNEHQRRIYEDFVFNDLSLGEIAGEEDYQTGRGRYDQTLWKEAFGL